jgi:hypothetical protein
LLPGHYGTKKDGSIDVNCRLDGNHNDGWHRL